MSRLVVLALMLCVLSIAACNHGPSPDELGGVVYEMPKVPGTQQPYPLPELDRAGDGKKSHGGHDHSHGDHAGHQH